MTRQNTVRRENKEINVDILFVGHFNLPLFGNTSSVNCDLSNNFIDLHNLVKCTSVVNQMQRKLDLILSKINISIILCLNFQQ